MNKLIRSLFILFYLLGMLLIYLSTIDKYDIIYDMDSTIPAGSLSNNQDDSGKVFAGLILFVILLVQAASVYFDRSKKRRWIAGIMATLAIFFFSIR